MGSGTIIAFAISELFYLNLKTVHLYIYTLVVRK